MIFKVRPNDFNPKFEVVTGFLIHGNNFLVMQYAPTKKNQPNRWGTPAGKLEAGESHLAGLLRELREETQLTYQPEQFRHIDTFFIRYPTFDYTYHIYRTDLSARPEVTIDPTEHQACQWVTIDQARGLDLIDDELPCIERVLLG